MFVKKLCFFQPCLHCFRCQQSVRSYHITLVNRLWSRNAANCFTQIIVNRYCKLAASARRNGVLSRYKFDFIAAFVIEAYMYNCPPLLFNLYVNDLLEELDAKKLGCCLGYLYISAILCMPMMYCCSRLNFTIMVY